MLLTTVKAQTFKSYILKVHNPQLDHYDDNIKAMVIIYIKHHGMPEYGNHTKALLLSIGINYFTYRNWIKKHNDINGYRDFMPRARGCLRLNGFI